MTGLAPAARGAALKPLGLAALLIAGGCTGEARVVDSPFTATGELIALSGGDGGPSNACFTCHGMQGQGDGLLAPRLAGLPEGYLVKQLQDYADGRRADPVMGPIARRLSPDHRLAVAAWYAALPAVPEPAPASTVPAAQGAIAKLYRSGDPARGIAACADCHGARGEGVGPANPPLAGQPPAYLAEQLQRWRRSERRNDPRQVMMTISRRLTGPEIAGLPSWAAGLSPPATSATGEASPSARRASAGSDGSAPPPRGSESGSPG